ncbi:MAG TPA: prolipoprotein diacylglyceryl transferase [Candidatus Limnocylindria bacterium]|nr:prolipoprotein diacylglyceryl transferase [Candidatus Limnocylindria bacterium]
MTIDVDPVLFHAGPVAVTWYGVIVGIALVAGVWLATREARRKGLPMEEVEALVLWVVVVGFVGARALHVVDRWEQYAAQPHAILALWNGGLAIVGAVLGGTVAGTIVAWRRGLPVLRLSDAAAPGVILGQAVGRFACLFTGDAVGRPTSGFGVTYLHPGAMVPERGVAYEPVFLYEMLWDLGVLAVLWWLRPRLRVDGLLFAAYLALYAVGKFALTYLRTETVWVAGLQEAQLLSIVALAVAAAWALAAGRQRFSGTAKRAASGGTEAATTLLP